MKLSEWNSQAGWGSTNPNKENVHVPSSIAETQAFERRPEGRHSEAVPGGEDADLGPVRRHGIQPSQVYQWQKVLFENGAAAFERTGRRGEDAKDRKVAALEGKVQQKNEVIAELMEENIRAKKAIGGP